MKNIAYIILAFTLTSKIFGQDVDSLKSILNSNPDNLKKIQTLNLLSEQIWLRADYHESRKYVDLAFKLEEVELKHTQFDHKLLLIEQAFTYNNLAIIYRFTGDYSQSLDNHLKALKIREEIGDKRGIARSNLGLGSIYEFLGNKETALKYKLKAKRLFEEVKDTLYVGFTCNHIAGIYFDLGNIHEAEKYNGIALMIFIKRSHLTGMADAFTLAGAIFEFKKEYEDAINNYKGSLQSSEIFGLKDRTISSNIDLGRIYIKINRLMEAKEYVDSALSLSKQTGGKNHLSDVYYLKYRIDSVSQNYKSQIKNYKLYVTYKDSLVNQKSSEKIALLQASFENDKTEKIKVLEEARKEQTRKEKEQKQKLILYSISGGLILMVILSIVVFRSYRLKQKVNNELLTKNEIIEKQKHLVEEKQTEILDSINYAKRIQYSLLASDKLLKDNLKDYFLFFKPKDVVSGDFYWGATLPSPLEIKERTRNFCLITADSTGHGVPGAIMSMLNISCLNEAINADKLTQPAEILNATRKKIIQHLSNDGSAEGGKDGMDCSLVSFDFNNNKLTYAAANNPVWIIRSLSPFEGVVRRTGDVEFISLPADRMPIGKHDKDSLPFTQHEIALQTGDMVYTLTDGFPDQFGGPKGKKFKYKQLEELLISIAHKSTSEQKEELNSVFENWKGNLEQVDDVCIIGVKI